MPEKMNASSAIEVTVYESEFTKINLGIFIDDTLDLDLTTLAAFSSSFII